MNGVDAIRHERDRQIAKGWTLEHDRDHYTGEMVQAAIVYAYYPGNSQMEAIALRSMWPWEIERLDKIKAMSKPERLAKAGALLAAEIDREQATIDEGAG